jgi:pyridoxal phosphate enzyme (YggS family)
MNHLKDNLQTVRHRIAVACQACGRDVQEVKLLAVSKTVTAERVQDMAVLGLRDFGENYIQEGLDKINALAGVAHIQPLSWYCIGPVQSNKTKWVAAHFDWVLSVDRLKIAQRLNEQRPTHLPPLQVCLQVNMDGGLNKSGVHPDEVRDLALAVTELPHLRLRGLMTIPEPQTRFDDQLALHQRTRALFDAVGAELGLAHWDTLSMGMTADLEAAVQAGSTLLRIGTALFGSRA